VLLHLAQTGPLTVGEAAVHLDRAQSVVSDIVSQLEGHGYVERENDPDDRRRSVGLADSRAGVDRLERDARVLDPGLVSTALHSLTTSQRTGLVQGLAALVAASGGIPKTQGKERDS
jgi:DNA-binding MarR family transcriptional regulator